MEVRFVRMEDRHTLQETVILSPAYRATKQLIRRLSIFSALLTEITKHLNWRLFFLAHAIGLTYRLLLVIHLGFPI
jgi:hypothetical protein